TPLVVATCDRAKLPMGPYLIALATSANIGSTATLVGNPQNILIGSMSGLHCAQYSLLAIIPCIAGVLVNLFLPRLYYRKKLPAQIPEEMMAANPKHQFKVPTAFVTALEGRAKVPLSLIVLAGVITGLFFGLDRGYTALAGVMVMVLAQREDPRPQFGR